MDWVKTNHEDNAFRKTVRSWGNGNCVDVCACPRPRYVIRNGHWRQAGQYETVVVADTAQDNGRKFGMDRPVLEFSGDAWREFTARVKA